MRQATASTSQTLDCSANPNVYRAKGQYQIKQTWNNENKINDEKITIGVSFIDLVPNRVECPSRP
jgi:hypothetical protein